MREILFRGKQTDNGEWVYGYYTKARYFLNKKEMHIIFEPDVEAFPHCEFTGYEEVLSETVGQYTGLTDKNGVRIFEGDIVKAFSRYDTQHTYAITYRNGVFWFGVWNFVEFIDRFQFAEVVGDIHNTPELLKGGGGNG